MVFDLLKRSVAFFLIAGPKRRWTLLECKQAQNLERDSMIAQE